MTLIERLRSKAEALRMQRKGQTGGWAGIALGIAAGVIGLGVMAIVLGAFSDSQPNGSDAQAIIDGGLTFLLNATAQFGTAGTILGVMLIVAIVAAFGFYAYQQTR